MNDFTKEELEKLMWCFSVVNRSYYGDVDFIKSKVQSMIDNYCEHENTDDCKCCGAIICEDCMECY